ERVAHEMQFQADDSTFSEIIRFFQDCGFRLRHNQRQFRSRAGPCHRLRLSEKLPNLDPLSVSGRGRRRPTMKLPRRTFLQFAGAAAVAPAFSLAATAESYPSRPITMIVPYPAGGATDVVARILAERMRQSLGQPIIVENVSGA